MDVKNRTADVKNPYLHFDDLVDIDQHVKVVRTVIGHMVFCGSNAYDVMLSLLAGGMCRASLDPCIQAIRFAVNHAIWLQSKC